MFKQKSGAVNSHFRNNYILYAIVLLTFLLGALLGADGVRSIAQSDKDALGEYLSARLPSGGESFREIFMSTLLTNLMWGGGVWVLGLTAALLPVMLVLVSARGFALGFSAAFLLNFYGAAGYQPAAALIFPSCLISVPLMTALAVFALRNGLRRKVTRRKRGGLASYVALGLIFAAAFVTASAAESGLCFGFVKIF